MQQSLFISGNTWRLRFLKIYSQNLFHGYKFKPTWKKNNPSYFQYLVSWKNLSANHIDATKFSFRRNLR
ncbi:hypothetical protein REPUB_Repub04eG0233100 [Reevesia pubescens]